MSDSESTDDDFEEVMFTVQEIELDVAVKVLIGCPDKISGTIIAADTIAADRMAGGQNGLRTQ